MSQENNYCVYSHSYDGVICYIGCGNKGRPQQTFPRNYMWTEYFNKRGMPEITIMAEFKSYKKALSHEKKLINRLKPILNVFGMELQRRKRWASVEEWERRNEIVMTELLAAKQD